MNALKIEILFDTYIDIPLAAFHCTVKTSLGSLPEFSWVSIQQYSSLTQYPLEIHQVQYHQLWPEFHHSYTIIKS